MYSKTCLKRSPVGQRKSGDNIRLNMYCYLTTCYVRNAVKAVLKGHSWDKENNDLIRQVIS